MVTRDKCSRPLSNIGGGELFILIKLKEEAFSMLPVDEQIRIIEKGANEIIRAYLTELKPV